MSLNTEFYGSPVTLTNDYPELKGPGLWTKGSSQADAYTFGAFVDNNPTGYDGVIAPLDESIIPWKIGAGSDAFKRATLIPGYNGTNYDLKILQATQPHKGIEDGYRFLLTYKGAERAYWNCRHSPWTTKTDYTNGAFPYERYCAPIVNFNYQNTIGIMYVLVFQRGSGTTGNYRYITLKEFLSNSTYSLDSWYVTGFSYQIFVKSSNNTFSTFENLQMMNFDEYVKHPDEFVNGNVYGENYHHYLMPIVRNTQETSGTLTPANRPTIGGFYGQYTADRDNGAAMSDQSKDFKTNYNFMCSATRSTYFITMGGYGEDLANEEFTPANQWLINGYNYWQLLAIPKVYNDLGSKQAIYDYAMTQAAYMGFIFTIGSPTNDEDKYVPEINSNGVTTGRYEPYPTTTLPNKTWTDDVLDETPYDPEGDVPDPDPDPTPWDEDLQTIMHTVALDQNIGCMDYLMTGHALNELIRVLSWYKAKEASGEIAEGSCATLFGTTDPLECIQTIIVYPYDLSTIWTGAGAGSAIPVTGTYMSASQGVYCGLTELVVTGYDTGEGPWSYLFTGFDSILQINWNYSLAIYNPETIPYFDRYKNFLSYEPYCDAELYIPFCGSVKIDPQLFAGHDIKVSYNVAVSEGSCRADIYRDNLLVDSITGNIGAQVGLSSADIVAKVNAVQQANATITAQKTNLVKSVAGFGIAAAATVATGGTGAPLAASLGAGALGATASAVSTRQSIETAEYQIKQAEVPFHKLTTGHGFSVLTSEDGVRLNVYRPTCLPGYSRTDWGSYGHTTGFACLRNDVLSNYHGLTVCSSVDLTGTTCTAKEAEMIKSALKTGVYLP